MSDRRRDDFPNHFVGDLVQTDCGWVVVPPTACPGRPRLRRRRLVGEFGLVYLQRSAHAVACPCGKFVYAPQAGAECRIRDRGPVSTWEDEHRG